MINYDKKINFFIRPLYIVNLLWYNIKVERRNNGKENKKTY